MEWLIKPYPGINLPGYKTNFNNIQSSARIFIEQSFSRLKSRWRILLKRQDTEQHNMNFVITSCFILHNVCEVANCYDYNWNGQSADDIDNSINIETNNL